MSKETSETKETPKKKPTKKDAAVELSNAIVELTKRVDALEAKNEVIIEGFEFAANETRALFGLGAFGVIFDAIVKRLRS